MKQTWAQTLEKKAHEMHRKASVLMEAGDRMHRIGEYGMADMYRGKGLLLLKKASALVRAMVREAEGGK